MDGGTPDYLHNVCGCVGSAGPVPAPDPVDWPCEEVGVELDWLRFYWVYFQAEPQDPRPSLLEIMEQAGAEYVWGTSNAFDQLMDHVPPAFEERWRCMGCDFGVGGCDETCP